MEVNPSHYSLNFAADGVDMLFIDINIESYTPSCAVEIGIGNKYVSFYSNECLEKMNTQAGSPEFYDFLQQANEDFFSAQEELGAIGIDTEGFIPTKNNIRQIFSLFKTLSKNFGYYNNGYLDGFFNAQDIHDHASKVERIGIWKNDLREKENTILFEHNSTYRQLLEKISMLYTISPETLTWYKVDEIENLFEGRHVSVVEIENRKKAYVYAKNDTDIRFYSGDSAYTVAQQFHRPDGKQQNSITGKMANRGRYTGKVRTILTSYNNFNHMRQEMNDMQQGEVLVSQLTAPELMPALRKAGAVVTDLGGMLSHAAITSRELGIPCIVGTGNASKILKTGDLVEVDADAGTVTILSKVNTSTRSENTL